MATNREALRQQLIADYHGALIRLCTLRADNKHHLLFGLVELYPFDMNVPKGWLSGKVPWKVPGTDGWTCALSVRKVSVAEALDWYESAAAGHVHIGQKDKPVNVELVELGPEPEYGGFCLAVDAPFTLLWHDDPRIHRYVPLTENPRLVRRLAANAAARTWLTTNLGFDPYRFDEWLGGLALVAPDPLCSSVSVFPSARAEDGTETLSVYLVPRRSKERGIVDISALSLHLAERRINGWRTVRTISPAVGGYSQIGNPQPCGEIAYALVCPNRGLLRFAEPRSWMEEISMSVNVSNRSVRVEVPKGGRRKPAKTFLVHQFFKGSDVRVGKPLNVPVRLRLVELRERREARERRAEAPQMMFGVGLDKTDFEAEINAKRKEAEDFVAGLVAGAKRRVLFVDPFFGGREMRLFALRASTRDVTCRILTGLPALINAKGKTSSERTQPGYTFLADLQNLEQQRARVPGVRVMPGGDTPAIHDRFLIVDDHVWYCGPSFNELGQRMGVMARLTDPLPVRRYLNAAWAGSPPLADFWAGYASLKGSE